MLIDCCGCSFLADKTCDDTTAVQMRAAMIRREIIVSNAFFHVLAFVSKLKNQAAAHAPSC